MPESDGHLGISEMEVERIFANPSNAAAICLYFSCSRCNVPKRLVDKDIVTHAGIKTDGYQTVEEWQEKQFAEGEFDLEIPEEISDKMKERGCPGFYDREQGCTVEISFTVLTAALE